MKEVIFALAVFGTIVTWMIWGIFTGSEVYRVKARHFLAAALCCTTFAIGWAIIYGA